MPNSAAKPSVSDDHFYDQVAIEIASGALNRGLWLRVFAEASGDKELAQAKYVQLRVSQLKQMNEVEDPKMNKSVELAEFNSPGQAQIPAVFIWGIPVLLGIAVLTIIFTLATGFAS